MMTTTKRNTSVAQHTAMIITRPGHHVSSVGQKVDLGAVKTVWKNRWVLPNEQCIIRYASVTHAIVLCQGHRYMQRGYLAFRTNFFPKQSTPLFGTRYFLTWSPDDQALCVSVVHNWCSARNRKAQLCYPWETSSPSACAISCCIRFSFRERCWGFQTPLGEVYQGAAAVPTNQYCSRYHFNLGARKGDLF